MKKILLTLVLGLAILVSCGSDNEETGSTQKKTETVEHIDSDYTYELPVIFHVLYSNQADPKQYIPYQRLANLLQYVNQIYEGGVYGGSENVHVRFVLATKDENGKTMRYPGVEYVHYTGEYPIDVNKFMSDNSGDNVKYIWEPNNYINVMMFNFKQSNASETTLGISHMPYTHEGSHKLEGLETIAQDRLTKSNLRFAYCSAINSLYANQADDGGYYQSDRYTRPDHQATTLSSADIVVTMAHELGHYLGLYHAFTESKNAGSVEPVDSCGDTDYCADTYSYNRNEYMEYLSRLSANDLFNANLLLARNSCDGVRFNSENIMDYSLTLGFQITREQKQRIRNVLYYSPLIPGPKMDATSSTRASIVEGPINLKITTIK